jgi:protein AroM
MPDKLVGALTIGQSPRPDLVDPLRRTLPDGWRVKEVGALDGLSAALIPPIKERVYPLTTQLRDGSVVLVEESFLLPRLQQALERLETEGAAASILLCAGTFSGLQGRRPFFKPFAVARDELRARGLKYLGLITPIKEQEMPIRQRWQAAGFEPTVWTADLSQQDQRFRRQLAAQSETQRVDCIVLDYVGHPAEAVAQLQLNCPLPVIDLGQLAMSALAITLQRGTSRQDGGATKMPQWREK